jgi:hypothetical protein
MAAAAIPLLLKFGLPLLGGAAGFLGAPKTPESTMNSTRTASGTSNPLYDEKTGIARDQILQNLLTQVDNTPDFARSYVAGGLDNINSADNARSKILDSLTQRSGFGSSPSSAVARGMGQNFRLQNNANFLNAAPLQMEQLRQGRVGQLTDFFKSLPVGTQTNQSETAHSKTVGTPANSPWASALGSAGGMLAGLAGMGAFNKKVPGVG